MFEIIGTLFTIAFWAAAIFLFLVGIILCIRNLINGNAWKKFMAVVAIILGVFTFFRVYAWIESIVFCLLATGIVLGLVADFGSGELESAPSRASKYDLGDALLEAYAEKQLMKEAVKEAIRESKD